MPAFCTLTGFGIKTEQLHHSGMLITMKTHPGNFRTLHKTPCILHDYKESTSSTQFYAA